MLNADIPIDAGVLQNLSYSSMLNAADIRKIAEKHNRFLQDIDKMNGQLKEK